MFRDDVNSDSVSELLLKLEKRISMVSDILGTTHGDCLLLIRRCIESCIEWCWKLINDQAVDHTLSFIRSKLSLLQNSLKKRLHLKSIGMEPPTAFAESEIFSKNRSLFDEVLESHYLSLTAQFLEIQVYIRYLRSDRNRCDELSLKYLKSIKKIKKRMDYLINAVKCDECISLSNELKIIHVCQGRLTCFRLACKLSEGRILAESIRRYQKDSECVFDSFKDWDIMDMKDSIKDNDNMLSDNNPLMQSRRSSQATAQSFRNSKPINLDELEIVSSEEEEFGEVMSDGICFLSNDNVNEQHDCSTFQVAKDCIENIVEKSKDFFCEKSGLQYDIETIESCQTTFSYIILSEQRLKKSRAEITACLKVNLALLYLALQGRDALGHFIPERRYKRIEIMRSKLTDTSTNCSDGFNKKVFGVSSAAIFFKEAAYVCKQFGLSSQIPVCKTLRRFISESPQLFKAGQQIQTKTEVVQQFNANSKIENNISSNAVESSGINVNFDLKTAYEFTGAQFNNLPKRATFLMPFTRVENDFCPARVRTHRRRRLDEILPLLDGALKSSSLYCLSSLNVVSTLDTTADAPSVIPHSTLAVASDSKVTSLQSNKSNFNNFYNKPYLRKTPVYYRTSQNTRKHSRRRTTLKLLSTRIRRLNNLSSFDFVPSSPPGNWSLSKVSRLGSKLRSNLYPYRVIDLRQSPLRDVISIVSDKHIGTQRDDQPSALLATFSPCRSPPTYFPNTDIKQISKPAFSNNLSEIHGLHIISNIQNPNIHKTPLMLSNETEFLCHKSSCESPYIELATNDEDLELEARNTAAFCCDRAINTHLYEEAAEINDRLTLKDYSSNKSSKNGDENNLENEHSSQKNDHYGLEEKNVNPVSADYKMNGFRRGSLLDIALSKFQNNNVSCFIPSGTRTPHNFLEVNNNKSTMSTRLVNQTNYRTGATLVSNTVDLTDVAHDSDRSFNNTIIFNSFKPTPKNSLNMKATPKRNSHPSSRVKMHLLTSSPTKILPSSLKKAIRLSTREGSPLRARLLTQHVLQDDLFPHLKPSCLVNLPLETLTPVLSEIRPPIDCSAFVNRPESTLSQIKAPMQNEHDQVYKINLNSDSNSEEATPDISNEISNDKLFYDKTMFNTNHSVKNSRKGSAAISASNIVINQAPYTFNSTMTSVNSYHNPKVSNATLSRRSRRQTMSLLASTMSLFDKGTAATIEEETGKKLSSEANKNDETILLKPNYDRHQLTIQVEEDYNYDNILNEKENFVTSRHRECIKVSEKLQTSSLLSALRDGGESTDVPSPYVAKHLIKSPKTTQDLQMFAESAALELIAMNNKNCSLPIISNASSSLNITSPILISPKRKASLPNNTYTETGNRVLIDSSTTEQHRRFGSALFYPSSNKHRHSNSVATGFTLGKSVHETKIQTLKDELIVAALKEKEAIRAVRRAALRTKHASELRNAGLFAITMASNDVDDERTINNKRSCSSSNKKHPHHHNLRDSLSSTSTCQVNLVNRAHMANFVFAATSTAPVATTKHKGELVKLDLFKSLEDIRDKKRKGQVSSPSFVYSPQKKDFYSIRLRQPSMENDTESAVFHHEEHRAPDGTVLHRSRHHDKLQESFDVDSVAHEEEKEFQNQIRTCLKDAAAYTEKTLKRAALEYIAEENGCNGKIIPINTNLSSPSNVSAIKLLSAIDATTTGGYKQIAQGSAVDVVKSSEGWALDAILYYKRDENGLEKGVAALLDDQKVAAQMSKDRLRKIPRSREELLQFETDPHYGGEASSTPSVSGTSFFGHDSNDGSSLPSRIQSATARPSTIFHSNKANKGKHEASPEVIKSSKQQRSQRSPNSSNKLHSEDKLREKRVLSAKDVERRKELWTRLHPSVLVNLIPKLPKHVQENVQNKMTPWLQKVSKSLMRSTPTIREFVRDAELRIKRKESMMKELRRFGLLAPESSPDGKEPVFLYNTIGRIRDPPSQEDMQISYRLRRSNMRGLLVRRPWGFWLRTSHLSEKQRLKLRMFMKSRAFHLRKSQCEDEDAAALENGREVHNHNQTFFIGTHKDVILKLDDKNDNNFKVEEDCVVFEEASKDNDLLGGASRPLSKVKLLSPSRKDRNRQRLSIESPSTSKTLNKGIHLHIDHDSISETKIPCLNKTNEIINDTVVDDKPNKVYFDTRYNMRLMNPYLPVQMSDRYWNTTNTTSNGLHKVPEVFSQNEVTVSSSKDRSLHLTQSPACEDFNPKKKHPIAPQNLNQSSGGRKFTHLVRKTNDTENYSSPYSLKDR